MGRLLVLKDGVGFPDGLDETWFFPRMRYRRDEDRGYKRWIDWWATYQLLCPHLVYVDQEFINPPYGSPPRQNKIAIREFIEDNCAGLVIMALKDLSFSYKERGSAGYVSDYHRCSRGYYVFHFQDAASAVAFKFRFEDITEDFARIKPEMEEYYSTKVITWEVQERGELIPLDEDGEY